MNASAAGDVEISAPFNNLGTVNVTDGSLFLSGPGTDTGTYAIAAGKSSSSTIGRSMPSVQSTASTAAAARFTIDGYAHAQRAPIRRRSRIPPGTFGETVSNSSPLTLEGDVIVERGVFSGSGVLTTSARHPK